MPKDSNFETKLMPQIKDWRLEGGEMIVGEGPPRIILRYSHIASDHMVEVTIVPYSEVTNESRNDGGVVRTLVVSTPGVSVQAKNIEFKAKAEPTE